MGKPPKVQQIEVPDPPKAEQYKGGSIFQDGRLVSQTSRGSDGTIDTNMYTSPYQKELKRYREKQLYRRGGLGGLEVDYSNYLKEADQRYQTDQGAYRDYYSPETIKGKIDAANILSPQFQSESDRRMQARYDMMLEPYNQNFEDIVRGQSNEYANRFGSLNASGYQDTMDRTERNYVKGLVDITNVNQLERLKEQAWQQQQQQMGLQNYLDERNATYNRMQNYPNQVGAGLNYYNTGIAQHDVNPLASMNLMTQGANIANQEYNQQLAHNQQYNQAIQGQNALAMQQANRGNPWLSAGLGLAGMGLSFIPGVGPALGAGTQIIGSALR